MCLLTTVKQVFFLCVGAFCAARSLWLMVEHVNMCITIFKMHYDAIYDHTMKYGRVSIKKPSDALYVTVCLNLMSAKPRLNLVD